MRLHDDRPQPAPRLDGADPGGAPVGARLEERQVLVGQHSQGDPGHVEPVEEVLERGLGGAGGHLLLLLVLQHALASRLDNDHQLTFAICQTMFT